MTRNLGRATVDRRLAEARARIAELEQEIVIKNEQRARYDDRIRALRSAISTVLSTGKPLVASVALAADDKAAAEMPE